MQKFSVTTVALGLTLGGLLWAAPQAVWADPAEADSLTNSAVVTTQAVENEAEETKAAAVVGRFWASVNDKNYGQAWNCLSSASQLKISRLLAEAIKSVPEFAEEEPEKLVWKISQIMGAGQEITGTLFWETFAKEIEVEALLNLPWEAKLTDANTALVNLPKIAPNEGFTVVKENEQWKLDLRP